jgi:hypothetical protein
MTRVNAYANFITKQRRIENNGLLRSGSSSDDGELLNEIFFDYDRESKAAFNTSVGAKLGAVTGATLGGISAFKSAYQTTGDPTISSFAGIFGGAAAGLAGAGFGSLVGNVIGSYEDKKEYQKNLQYQRNMEQQNLALQNIKAKNEHLREVALAERKRQVEARLHSLRNQHGVNMTRIPTGNGPHDTAVRITGGPLPQGHEIVFHDDHSVANDNEPSQFSWEHNVAMQRMTSPTGEGVTVRKPLDSSSHSDLDSSITNLNAHLQRMGRRRAGELSEMKFDDVARHHYSGWASGLAAPVAGLATHFATHALDPSGFFSPTAHALTSIAGGLTGGYLAGRHVYKTALFDDIKSADEEYHNAKKSFGETHSITQNILFKRQSIYNELIKMNKGYRHILPDHPDAPLPQ